MTSRPGYHMNKKHWITLHPAGDLQTQLIDDLVTESYLLVVENLPRTRSGRSTRAIVRRRKSL